MTLRLWFASVFVGLVVASVASSNYRDAAPAEELSKAGAVFLSSLDANQRKLCLLEYTVPERLDWHFIPKDYRKGLQVKQMNAEQRKQALTLLQVVLSEVGYRKATTIMSLEKLLNELEAGKGKFARDHERYYFTLFGQPSDTARWGLSVEGHHMSLNFVIEGTKVISSTPQFLAANPATIKNDNKSGFEVGFRLLGDEEQLAFDLVKSLTPEQAAVGVIAEQAPKEIRNDGKPQPPAEAAVGISADQLSDEQRQLLKQLVDVYVDNVAPALAQERRDAIMAADFKAIHFAWAGAKEPGIGHYYRVQGPTFLIEFVNTQPDAVGNPANHIHSVYRDMRGDFALPGPPVIQ